MATFSWKSLECVRHHMFRKWCKQTTTLPVLRVVTQSSNATGAYTKMDPGTHIREDQQGGFSIVESLIVVLILTIIAAIVFPDISGITRGMNANTALTTTVAQLRRGRELAIAQRRNIQIRFQNNDQIQLVRNDVPSGTTVLSTVSLGGGGMQFMLIDGVPDSPDSFGKRAAIDFGSATSTTFLSDGTLVDSQGNPVSGSIFMASNNAASARAVTIMGSTGRVRGYRWTGTQWIQ
jgi:prepilin-type N-terminal cleavage/methylation domain-containing protein